MAKPGVYRFPGSPIDVVVTLSHSAEKVVPENHMTGRHAKENGQERHHRVSPYSAEGAIQLL